MVSCAPGAAFLIVNRIFSRIARVSGENGAMYSSMFLGVARPVGMMPPVRSWTWARQCPQRPESNPLPVSRTAQAQIDIYTKKFIQLDMSSNVDAASAVEEVYRSDWGRIVATLIRLFGDFDLAEECAQEAFAAAVDQWRESGVPDIPRAWIIQTARHKAIDRIRRKGVYAEKLDSYAVSGMVRAAEE